MAIGAYMALRRCSVDQARAALIDAAGSVQIGLGAISQALLSWVGDAGLTTAADSALTYWREHLSAPGSVAAES